MNDNTRNKLTGSQELFDELLRPFLIETKWQKIIFKIEIFCIKLNNLYLKIFKRKIIKRLQYLAGIIDKNEYNKNKW